MRSKADEELEEAAVDEFGALHWSGVALLSPHWLHASSLAKTTAWHSWQIISNPLSSFGRCGGSRGLAGLSQAVSEVCIDLTGSCAGWTTAAGSGELLRPAPAAVASVSVVVTSINVHLALSSADANIAFLREVCGSGVFFGHMPALPRGLRGLVLTPFLRLACCSGGLIP